MLKNREELFKKLLSELQQEDFIAECNFYDENALNNDFIEVCNRVFQDLHILDLMHEVK